MMCPEQGFRVHLPPRAPTRPIPATAVAHTFYYDLSFEPSTNGCWAKSADVCLEPTPESTRFEAPGSTSPTGLGGGAWQGVMVWVLWGEGDWVYREGS